MIIRPGEWLSDSLRKPKQRRFKIDWDVSGVHLGFVLGAIGILLILIGGIAS